MPRKYSFPVTESAPKKAVFGAETAPVPSGGNRTTVTGAETALLSIVSGRAGGSKVSKAYGPALTIAAADFRECGVHPSQFAPALAEPEVQSDAHQN